MFSPVPPDIDFVALEQAELARWAAHRVFERSVEQREGAPPWVFYEGPPTANGMPGLHHVWARVYKDLFCRFRTMTGPTWPAGRAGTPTGSRSRSRSRRSSGSPASNRSKSEVGIAEFTRLCRESVVLLRRRVRRLTTASATGSTSTAPTGRSSPDYIESVWWHLQQLFDQGLLYEDLKVVPYCPRCGTALSSHELGQPDVYRDEEDESAYVRLPLVDAGPRRSSAMRTWLAVWTTTPWTLLSNTGVAVNPDLDLRRGRRDVRGRRAGRRRVLGEGASTRVTTRSAGCRARRAPLRAAVRRPRPDRPAPTDGGSWPADYVTTDEGTGLVHLAPAFGEIDRQIGRENGLPSLNPVGPDGRFTDARSRGWPGGMSATPTTTSTTGWKRAAPDPARPVRPLVPALLALPHPAHLLGQAELVHRHLDPQGRPARRPTPPSTGTPRYIRDGRFGEWLANNVDWALSRDRYWGTPLPVWRCGRGHLRCVGSLAELSDLCGRDVTGHRPAPSDDRRGHVRLLDLRRRGRRRRARGVRRVEPVIDAWFDSGSMPAAQVGLSALRRARRRPSPSRPTSSPRPSTRRAAGSTRCWPSTRSCSARAPYRHVVCLGHIVDADGRKMSKSLGNIIDPWQILDTRGADAMRWWMFSQGSPWTPTRATLAAIDTAMRDTLLTLWNTFSFFTTYASLNEFDPADSAIPAPADRGPLDRWILSRLASTTARGDRPRLTDYEPLHAATALADLVDDVSNWYVRRSRRRFWRTDPDAPPATPWRRRRRCTRS